MSLAVNTLLLPLLLGQDPFPGPRDTQEETVPVMEPEKALQSLDLPEGFRASLFAAEPDVRQPIACALDARGRLWVAENYSYAEHRTGYDRTLRDRIIILEDTDGDGRADRRKVFWDRGRVLTSVEIGFGGVWVIDLPRLLFIPDRDGDDVPDGEPEVLLDGWTDKARHNFANGLRWGPDGWLYGRHGILASSLVGAPGTPPDRRVQIGTGIWRFHPTRRTVEVVCRGGTNPWGMDWDAHGEAFAINTVIGHLWHAIPGAHFRRMFGEDPTPYVYRLIEQTADHFHWETSEGWGEVARGASDATRRAGGGHAHSGLMIYLGDNWPAEYRGDLFTLNFHGRRINRDALVREGATYVGKHRTDVAAWKDPYFRGIDLLYGPDGGVYVTDWSDIGECHDNDGVHRSSGRIYKIVWGKAKAPVGTFGDADLVRVLIEGGEWHSRQARRILQERAPDPAPLRKAFLETRGTARLRAMWGLHAVEPESTDLWIEALEDDDEHVRSWAVRLLSERNPTAGPLADLAARESSGLVLTYLASALQRLPAADRWPLAAAIASHGGFADDRVLPLMLWYGVREAVPDHPVEAAKLADACAIPLVASFIARRLTEDLERRPGAMEALVGSAAKGRRDLLSGIADALRGRVRADPPPGWREASEALATHGDEAVRALAREISVVFGDGRALEDLRGVAASKEVDLDARRRALRGLVDARAENLVPLLTELVGHRDLGPDAVRGLARMAPGEAPGLLLARLPKFYQTAIDASIEELTSRVDWAKPFLNAVEAGTVDRRHVTAFQLRRMQLFEDPAVNGRLAKLWPDLRLLDAGKVERIAALRRTLTADRPAKADRRRGGELFARTCGKCHRLFGDGPTIGPDLTGGQRSDLGYLLQNVVDPSADVAESYRVSILYLTDDRILNGVVVERTERTLALQTPDERMVIDRKEILRERTSELSMMPEGLVDGLTEEEVADLFAYLMGDGPAY